MLDLSRRMAIGSVLAAASASVIAPRSATAAVAKKRAAQFLCGAATAAYQVEGDNINTDWWLLENLPKPIIKIRSGDAVDHYRLFEQDIALLAKLGFNSYRFSIEWARIEPEPGKFSAAAVAHYRDVLDACHRHGLQTVVTLHHFTSPIWFCLRGGFENPDAPNLFAHYAQHIAQTLGDKIDWLCTINEINVNFFPMPKAMALEAARSRGSDRFSSFLFDDVSISRPILRDCHVAARKAFNSVRPEVPVGMTLAMADFQDAPGTSGGANAARSAAYDVYLKLARDDAFIGVQTYTRELYDAAGERVHPSANVLKTQVRFEYYPPALEGTIRYAASVANVPILVTENGVGIEDDRLRVQYIDGALAGMDRCIADGIDVRGYLHWSLIDNFEWMLGYAPKFGLVAVDRATQVRTPKPSAYHLGGIARSRQARETKRRP